MRFALIILSGVVLAGCTGAGRVPTPIHATGTGSASSPSVGKIVGLIQRPGGPQEQRPGESFAPKVLTDAQVSVLAGTRTVATTYADQSGHYKLSVPPGTYSMHVKSRLTGCVAYSNTITVHANQNASANFACYP